MSTRSSLRADAQRRRRASYVELLEEEEFELRLQQRRRSRQHGLGLTVAGGGGSHPYRGDDEGVFVAKVIAGGAADMAGLKVDDEILSINGIPVDQLDHYQTVDMLRNARGDLKIRVKRQSPRLVESAVPTAQSIGPIIRRSQSSFQLSSPGRRNSGFSDARPSGRRSRSNSQHEDTFYRPEEEEDGYLRPRTPPSVRRMSSYQPEPLVPYPLAIQHSHLDTMGVHFHPYCFACNPSLIHLNPALLPGVQTGYGSPVPMPPSQHIYARPNHNYPSPIQLRTYASASGGKKWEQSLQADDDDDSESERITVRLKRDELNGLGFIVSSRDGQASDNGGVYVSGIVKNGVADRSGQLVIGDRILSINGIDVQEARHKDVVGLLSRSKPYVQLEIERDPTADYPEVFESDEPGAFTSATSRYSQLRRHSTAADLPSASSSRRNSGYNSGDNVDPPVRPIMKSSLKSSFSMRSRSGSVARPPPSPSPPLPPPPPPPPKKHTVAESDSSRMSDLQFPPPPTELGRFRETITKQTLTETVVTRLTSNQKGKWPVITEDVAIHKDIGARLGLRIAGGTDSVCTPFGIDEPGVFISRVVPHGAAARTGRLRIGDRLLKINGRDVSKWTHPEVIRALCDPAPQIILTIRHDPPPEGLDEFLVHRGEDEQYGIKIIGGVKEQSSYQTKVYDSGIFVSRIHRGGAIGRDGRVKVGMRLLEVNGTNMIGVTRQEAIEAFRRAGHILRLLVCDGWNKESVNGSVLGEESSSVMSNGSSLDDRSSFRRRSVSSIKPITENDDHESVPRSGKSTPSSSRKMLGLKLSDLTGSRHFPKTPPEERQKDIKTTTIVMTKNSTLRPDKEYFDEN